MEYLESLNLPSQTLKELNKLREYIWKEIIIVYNRLTEDATRFDWTDEKGKHSETFNRWRNSRDSKAKLKNVQPFLGYIEVEWEKWEDCREYFVDKEKLEGIAKIYPYTDEENFQSWEHFYSWTEIYENPFPWREDEKITREVPSEYEWQTSPDIIHETIPDPRTPEEIMDDRKEQKFWNIA
jgi:hypothetical protein